MDERIRDCITSTPLSEADVVAGSELAENGLFVPCCHTLLPGIMPQVQHTIQLGSGCDRVPLQDGDIVLATTGQSIRFSSDGKIRIGSLDAEGRTFEREVGTDAEVVAELRRVIMGFLREESISQVLA